jgi:phospholipid-binding lipoprotein MlaA
MSPRSSACPTRSTASRLRPRRHRFGARSAARLAAIALGGCIALAGCATLPSGKPDPSDRFERFNRAVYKFNTAIDHAVLRPIARTYVRVTPRPVRTAISNVVTNLGYPVTLVNSFLQGRLDDGMTDTARLLVNSTIGLGGLFDPATGMGLDRHEQDFGLTLGHWGVHSGPYLMLPLLGPSTVRDGFGLVPDYLLLHEIETVKAFKNNPYAEWSLFSITVINRRAQLLDEDPILERSYDPYAFLRGAYLQRREYLIHGAADTSPEQQFPDSDLQGAEPAPPGATPPLAPPPGH